MLVPRRVPCYFQMRVGGKMDRVAGFCSKRMGITYCKPPVEMQP